MSVSVVPVPVQATIDGINIQVRVGGEWANRDPHHGEYKRDQRRTRKADGCSALVAVDQLDGDVADDWQRHHHRPQRETFEGQNLECTAEDEAWYWGRPAQAENQSHPETQHQ